MFKMLKCLLALALVAAAFYMVSVVRDKQLLEEQVLRLHVVGASDAQEDQELKLQVRDAVLQAVQEAVSQAPDKDAAEDAVEELLPQLKEAADQVLIQAGSTDRATVRLSQEEFPKREYDTFTLPAGVYDSLRVTIGEGSGRNWWCVVFPGLCVPAASQQVEDVATGAGFSQSLSGAITGQEGYEIRFWILDWLGRVENFFHR